LNISNIFNEIDINHHNKMSLLQYLVWSYKVNWNELMLRPQGVSKLLEECEKKKKKKKINQKKKEINIKQKK